MKRALLFSTALALLLLAGCRSNASPAPTPSAPPSSAVSDVPVPTILLPDDARYFFFQGHFLGSVSGSQWHSASDGGFTLGELFNRNYPDPWGEDLRTVRFFAADGPGAFDDPQQAADLLQPFGVLEGSDFIMYIPAQLTGDAADIPVPTSGFYTMFNGQTYRLLSSTALTLPEMAVTGYALTDAEVDQALAAVGVSCYQSYRPNYRSWQCDLDGDGQAETLELLSNHTGSDGAPLNEGEPCFYLLAIRDEDSLTIAASKVAEYTGDVTACFTAADLLAADLDGDGASELIFREACWESGCIRVLSQQNGQWTEVLRADYGT